MCLKIAVLRALTFTKSRDKIRLDELTLTYAPPYEFESEAGHVASSHVESTAASPSHMFPPLLGAGLSHCLVLSVLPGPHVALHCETVVQAPQLPSTTTKQKKIYIY